jgi:hypothetical protein
MSHENGLSFVCDRMCRTMCSLFLKAWLHCGHFHPLVCRLRSWRWASASESFALPSSCIVIIWSCGECLWEIVPRILRDCAAIYRRQQTRTSGTTGAELGVSTHFMPFIHVCSTLLRISGATIPRLRSTMTFYCRASSTRL